MPPVLHSYDPPDRFVVGTVGPPGQRTFFLQARESSRLTSVSLEKQQVQILAERIDELLDELHQSTAAAPEDNGPLDQPIVDEFRAGTITLSWDGAQERVVIEVFPMAETQPPIEADEEQVIDLPLDEPEPSELFVVHLPVPMARAFSARAATVVAAGREQCEFCGGPIDPGGHLCPRANGYRRSV